MGIGSCRRRTAAVGVLVGLGAITTAASASQTFYFSDPSGLSAVATFDLIDATTFEVRYRNTSTGIPDGFSRADQILTSIAWDFGEPGAHFQDPLITGGHVLIGEESRTLGFDTGEYGPGTDVSGEYGYSSSGFPGLLQNYVTAAILESTPFGGPNLDGPLDIWGPQGGLIAEEFVPLGSLGAIQQEVVATLFLTVPVFDLDFLENNGTMVEFGMDAFYLHGVPAPGALGLLGLALLGRRRSRTG